MRIIDEGTEGSRSSHAARRSPEREVRARQEPAQFGGANDMLRLQRRAGNRAVASALASAQRSGSTPTAVPTVQRHSSWEHALLGDTPPGQLGNAAVTRGARVHVVFSEWQRMRFFRDNPSGDPRTRFPDVRWVQLRGSGLWVSYGELNALSDYLPDPSAVDTLDRAHMVPVLQRMRNSIYDAAADVIGLHSTSFTGAAFSMVPGAAGEVLALDSATAGLGTNRYKGLLARNACHFAPFSWQRWSQHHNEAREEAIAHHRALGNVAPVKDVTTDTDEHQRQAWLKNGYGDHFLQDSFAAGHLVNKTLVMQWFVDYLNSLSWVDKPWFGMPDAEVLAAMGSRQQTNIAGQTLYGHAPSSSDTSTGDRLFGTGVADPQTTQERLSREQRVAGSGVTATPGRSREQNYQAYLRFLNSSFLQKAAGAVHDHFNEHGLTVRNGQGTPFTVGGDDTMLAKSDQIGAETAGRAAELSRTAIQQLLRSGATAITVDQIWALMPQTVVTATGEMSLSDWQEGALHQLCLDVIFPQLISSLSENTVVRAAGDMVDGGI